MPTDAANIQDVCVAVKAVLDAVSGIGTVDHRPGGIATWIKRPREKQAYWSIDVLSVQERGAGTGRSMLEIITVDIHGYMPWSYEAPNTADTWRDLVTSVRNQLRTYPTLANAVDGIKTTRAPQLLRQERVTISGGGTVGDVLCHHAHLRIELERYFTYTVSTSL